MHVLAGSTKGRPAVWVQATRCFRCGVGLCATCTHSPAQGASLLPAPGIWDPGPCLSCQELGRPRGHVQAWVVLYHLSRECCRHGAPGPHGPPVCHAVRGPGACRCTGILCVGSSAASGWWPCPGDRLPCSHEPWPVSVLCLQHPHTRAQYFTCQAPVGWGLCLSVGGLIPGPWDLPALVVRGGSVVPPAQLCPRWVGQSWCGLRFSRCGSFVFFSVSECGVSQGGERRPGLEGR